MSSAPLNPVSYTDIAGLGALKRGAHAQSPQALREAARQFESLFMRMMLKSMREASSGDPNFDSQQGGFYRDMFDDQIAVDLSRGRGMGLADMLMRQLQRTAPENLNAESAAEKARALGFAAPAGDSKQLPPSTVTSPAYDSLPIDLLAYNIAPQPLDVSPDAYSAGIELAAQLAQQPDYEVTPIAFSIPALSPALGAGSATPNIALDPAKARFVADLWPQAAAAGRELGVDPAAIVAQAALETGWGRSMPADSGGASSFNLFGIKASNNWQGSAVASKTTEYADGLASTRLERFRGYDSPAASVRDYVQLLRGNARYAAALGTGSDIRAFADALQQGGYATDPQYSIKLQRTATMIRESLAGDLKGGNLSPISMTDDTV